MDTIIDWEAATRHRAHADGMSTVSDIGQVITSLASSIEQGQLSVPVAARFALEDVRDAYRQLEQRHTRGKIVLVTGRQVDSA